MAEALSLQKENYDIIINLQGDAPLTPPWVINELIAELENSNYQVATPVFKCDEVGLKNLLRDRKLGRVGATTVVFDNKCMALYFSKEVLPYTNYKEAKNKRSLVYHHIGVYAYKAPALISYLKLSPSVLETQEGLEPVSYTHLTLPTKRIV